MTIKTFCGSIYRGNPSHYVILCYFVTTWRAGILPALLRKKDCVVEEFTVMQLVKMWPSCRVTWSCAAWRGTGLTALFWTAPSPCVKQAGKWFMNAQTNFEVHAAFLLACFAAYGIVFTVRALASRASSFAHMPHINWAIVALQISPTTPWWTLALLFVLPW